MTTKFLKQTVLIVSTCLISLPTWAASPKQVGSLGLGASVGSTLSVLVQRPVNDRRSYNIGVEGDADTTSAFLDHLWYIPFEGGLHPYVGVGAQIGQRDDALEKDRDDEIFFAARVPIGMNYYAIRNRLNFNTQATPVIESDEGVDFLIQVGLQYFIQ